MRRFHIFAGLLTALLVGSIALADKITLKDGTVLEGTVIKQGDNYWYKAADGSSRVIEGSTVASVISGGGGSSATSDGGTDFNSAARRAGQAESALAAVAIWQEFIDKHGDSPDLPTAKKELARWKAMAADGAEKINGKWVGGEERKKILTQANDLIREGIDFLKQDQVLKAIAKFQQSVKVYPNSFRANFFLGQVSLMAKNYDDALRYYAVALHLNTQSCETLNNMAIANVFLKHFDSAITGFQKAAEIQDSKELTQNLINCLAEAGPAIRNQPVYKKVNETANLLASGYGITGPNQRYEILDPPPQDPNGKSTQGETPAMMWSGSGFFISDDGLILTNRHVAKDAKTLMVMMGDDQITAAVVVIDDEQDLALPRIKTKDKVPFLHFSKTDIANEGAECVVMGYPLIDRLGADIKITRGIAPGTPKDSDLGPDLLTDAKVNPGNSGGPILNKFGNVMAIVTMKSLSSRTEDSYGIGISAGHIRKFLAKNHIDVTPGDDTGAGISTEDIAAKVKPATIWILGTK